MKLFKVDYVVKDADKFKAEQPKIASLVLGNSFEEAYQVAKQFENDYVELMKLDFAGDANVAVKKEAEGIFYV